ncbi:MAG: hypothetical protein WCP97_01360 [bacterium]
MKKNHFFSIIFLFAIAACCSSVTYAIAPPDFLFTVATYFWQLFSFLFAISLGLGSFFLLNVKSLYQYFRKRPLLFIAAIILLVSFCAIVAYVYDQSLQKNAYETWLQQQQQLTP